MGDTNALIEYDDESFALQLQLEEINAQRELHSGDTPAELTLAFNDFATELTKAKSLVEDQKLAHSIARAVDSDSMAIDNSKAEEAQCLQDRGFALSLNEDETLPAQDATTTSEASHLETESADWDEVIRASKASIQSIEFSTVLGSSAPYARRQQAILDYLPQFKVQCSVCGDSVYPHTTVRLACNDIYCKPCLKFFFLRVAKDESLFPPKCHGQAIDFSVIEADFSSEELVAYRSAELEFSSTDRFYCAKPECAKFIPMPQRNPDLASCEGCANKTCMHCKALAHEGACPADEGRNSLITFGEEQGWKACFGCGEMVFRFEGCDHMTCRCGAEFCYKCGVKWKGCPCGDWEDDMLDQRAQQIVDREAQEPLAPVVRQERVRAMAGEIVGTHECTHNGRFTRIEGHSRRGQVCDMCGARHWKYILSCRRCHMLACEDCRRHRV